MIAMIGIWAIIWAIIEDTAESQSLGVSRKITKR